MTCSRCKHQGVVGAIRIKRLNRIVNVCDECDALWLVPIKENPVYGVDFVDFDSFLQQHGIADEPVEWESVDP